MRKSGTRYDDDDDGDTEIKMAKGDDPLLCNLANNQVNGPGHRFQMSSSESEMSDSDGSYLTGKQRSAYTKVRQAALGCLYAIVKVSSHFILFFFFFFFFF